MSDEQAMLAAYAASPDDDHLRQVLADWFEERGDVRGNWLRDRDLARWMGPTACDPIPLLVAALPEQEEAQSLLLRIGAPAVPALLAARHHPDQCSPEQIDAVLTSMAAAVPGLPELIQQLRSDDPRDQQAALHGLAERGEVAAPALPHILDLFQEDRESIRSAAIATLRRFGSLTGHALYAAWGRIDWGGHWTADRSAAYELLDAVEALRPGPDSPAVRILLEALGTYNPNIGEAVVIRLGMIGPVLFEPLLLCAARPTAIITGASTTSLVPIPMASPGWWRPPGTPTGPARHGAVPSGPCATATGKKGRPRKPMSGCRT